MPDGATKVTGLKIHGSRYGQPQAPKESFLIYFMNKDRKRILHTEMAPYSLFKRGSGIVGRDQVRDRDHRPTQVVLGGRRFPGRPDQRGVRQLRHDDRRQILADRAARHVVLSRGFRRRLDDSSDLREVIQPGTACGFQGSSDFALFCRSRIRTALGFSIIGLPRMMHQ